MALIKCPNCGKPISDRAEKCPQCGMTMQNATTAITMPIEEKKDIIHPQKRKNIFLLVIAGFLLIGVISFALIYYGVIKKGENDSDRSESYSVELVNKVENGDKVA